MPETPHHVSDKIDGILDRLNGSWDLELPRLHGRDLQRIGTEAFSLARKCSFRIRYLCYRSSHSVIDNTIADFETQAQTIFSQWVFKPSQERGTLPTIPKSQSFLKRDMLSRRTKEITPELRRSLLEVLSGILKDEYELAQQSESYVRESSQPSSNKAFKTPSKSSSRNASFMTALSESSRFEPQLQRTQHEIISNATSHMKRRKTSAEAQPGKRPSKRSQRLESGQSNQLVSNCFNQSKTDAKSNSNQFIAPAASAAKTMPQDKPVSKLIPQEITSSFNTTVSTVPSVFSRINSSSSIASGNTSLAESKTEASQDYFPSQDAREILADESFNSLLRSFDSTQPQPVFAFDDLNATTPFRGFDPLPEKLSFWLRWEIDRLAQSTELHPSIFLGSIERQREGSSPTYAEFWTIAATVCKNCNKILPAKSDVRPWMEQSNQYESPEGKSVYFTVTLAYNRERGPYMWRLVLEPIKVDKGNRIHRKYGADRHITCYLEYFDKSRLPKWVTSDRNFDENIAYDSIVDWLATEIHEIAGRQWRAFYLEPEKSQSRRRAGQPPRQKLNLFALSGDDFGLRTLSSSPCHTPMSFDRFLNWHIPLEENLDSTNLKLFSRFGLGLSKTRSTIVLEPEQFRLLPDEEPIMNDGCALMSVGMARAVWEICGDGTNNMPSAFQGRISGAKGLWIVDYRDGEITGDLESVWIEVSDSQLKIKPHPRHRPNADETQRSFEVLKWSTPCTPGHLNIQLINILADRGVSRATLAQLVTNDIEEYIKACRGAMKDPRLLQAWVHDFHGGDRGERPPSFDTGLPDTYSHSYETEADIYVDKLRIELPYSTSTFCVPDPYGVLGEDEVHLGFSTFWTNPTSGLKEIALDGIDILVSRNPAALASDIQKRRAVYKHELRHFKDVIVFPTRGIVPLASLLSGGDYDGDTVTVIWEPELVNNFQNVDKPELPDEERCGLQKVSRKLPSIFTTLPVTKEATNEFLRSCIGFNARQNVLGICTNEHELLVYNGMKLSDRGSILLATLAGYLVDANKQGLFMSSQKFYEIRGIARGGLVPVEMAYKSNADHIFVLNNGKCRNVMDHLKFDVALGKMNNVLKEFKNMFQEQKYDRALTGPWRCEDVRRKNQNDSERDAVGVVLDDLKLRLEQAYEVWLRRSNQNRRQKNAPKVLEKRDVLQDLETSDLSIDVQYIHGLLDAIEPVESDCDIYREFIRDTGSGETFIGVGNCKGSRWSLLRASAMYQSSWRSSVMMWLTVGDELARIKARSLGPTRELTPAMHHILKADCKFIKKLVGDNVEYDEDELEE